MATSPSSQQSEQEKKEAEQKAAEEQARALSEQSSQSDEQKSTDAASTPQEAPQEQEKTGSATTNGLPAPEATETERRNAVVQYGEQNEKQDESKYDPNSDADVPSSQLAEVIANELEGTGNSPTLEACREAAKQRKSDDDK